MNEFEKLDEEVKKMVKDGTLKTKIDISVVSGTNICNIEKITVSKNINYDHILIEEIDTIIGFPVYFRGFIMMEDMYERFGKPIPSLNEEKYFNNYVNNLYNEYKKKTRNCRRITKTEFIKELPPKEKEAYEKFIKHESIWFTDNVTLQEINYLKKICEDFKIWLNNEVYGGKNTTYEDLFYNNDNIKILDSFFRKNNLVDENNVWKNKGQKNSLAKYFVMLSNPHYEINVINCKSKDFKNDMILFYEYFNFNIDKEKDINNLYRVKETLKNTPEYKKYYNALKQAFKQNK